MTGEPTPLGGLVVVDLCVHRAGSVAGMLLADLGASVIRLETVQGDHRRASPVDAPDAVCWDRGKRTVVVGSFDPGADRESAAWLDRADVVLIDGPPAVVAASPLDPAQLSAAHSRLTVVWLPPYGAVGDAYADLPTDPLLLSAISGYAMHQPAIDSEQPVASVVPVPEYVQGSLAASAAVAGVLEREHSGRGQLSTVTGLDAVGVLLATLVNAALDVEQVFRPGRNPQSGPSFRSYRCGDGEMLFLATLVAPLFLKALDVLDAFDVMLIDGVDGEYLQLFEPTRGRIASQMLEDKFATQPRQHWLDRFEAAGVPCEPVQARSDWLESRHFRDAGGRQRFEHPAVGPVDSPRHPVRFSARPGGGPTTTGWPARPGAAGPGPLAGLRVVDLANFLAGPFAPTILAHWGADVVKVEPPDGDPYRLYTMSYLAVNHRKHSVSCDLRSAAGRAGFEALVASADVLVDNLRPSARQALDLPDELIARLNPDLVHARVTAFSGESDRPGFDPSIQALSGMMVAAGGPATPLNTTTPVHDVAAGASLALGILAGLWHRVRTGEVLEISGSLAAASSLLQCAELTTFAGRPESAHGGVDFIGPSSARRFYRAADGWMALGARSASEVDDVLIALGAAPGHVNDDDPHGVTAGLLADAIGRHAVAEVVAALRAAGIPATPVVGADWGSDAYLELNGFTDVVPDPVFGRCRVMSGAGRWSRSGRAPVVGLPPQGADTIRFANGWPPAG